MKKITVIGCGHGGLALAGHLAHLGHSLTLYAHHEHTGAIDEVAEEGRITLRGQIKGFGKIQVLTSQIDLAVQGADIIFLAIPVIAHEPLFKSMLPFLESGQIVINLAGHFSGVFQNEILNQEKHKKDIYIGDTSSFPYACRIVKKAEVEIIRIKNSIGIASTTPAKTRYLIEQLKDLFPTALEAKSSFIEVSLYDPSGISHVPNTIFNAARICNCEEFYFYKEGITPEIAALLEDMDQERISVGKRLGLDLLPYCKVMNRYYGLEYDTIFDLFKNSPIHNAHRLCPTSLDCRYLTEDVPFSLVPCYSAGINLSYTASVTKKIIEMASTLNKTDYLKNGRQLSTTHLETYHACG